MSQPTPKSFCESADWRTETNISPSLLYPPSHPSFSPLFWFLMSLLYRRYTVRLLLLLPFIRAGGDTEISAIPSSWNAQEKKENVHTQTNKKKRKRNREREKRRLINTDPSLPYPAARLGWLHTKRRPMPTTKRCIIDIDYLSVYM